MIIDFHTHLGNDNDGTIYSASELLSSMKANGIDKAVAFPFNEKATDLIDASISIAELGNESIIPFLRFDPHRLNEKKLREVLGKYHFKGVKLHPRAQHFDPLAKEVSWIYKVIQELNLPVIIHTRNENIPESNPMHVALLAESFPDMVLVLGHMADCLNDVVDFVKTYKNIYLETAIHSTPNDIKRIILNIGHERVLFGSDAPYSDQEIELLKLKKADISKEYREGLLHKNAEKILKLY